VVLVSIGVGIAAIVGLGIFLKQLTSAAGGR
jgi:hypothetical protein